MTKIGTIKHPSWGAWCGANLFVVDTKRDLPKDGKPGGLYFTSNFQKR